MVITIRLTLAAAFGAFVLAPAADAKRSEHSRTSFTTSSVIRDSVRKPNPASAKKPEPCWGFHCLWQR
jgi:hypothetical protein